MFPLFGFGAQVPPTWQVSHEFPLNFNPENPFCVGIEGVVHAYQYCLPQVKFWGPTKFSPIINLLPATCNLACFARQALKQNIASQYFVLLIITDGVITDMDHTRVAVVAASRLPMSIIIVGVGGADFSAMESLDSDNSLLCSPTDDLETLSSLCPSEISEETVWPFLSVLAELSDQVVSYFNSCNLKPPSLFGVSEPSEKSLPN